MTLNSHNHQLNIYSSNKKKLKMLQLNFLTRPKKKTISSKKKGFSLVVYKIDKKLHLQSELNKRRLYNHFCE